jgi:hypothetical protein
MSWVKRINSKNYAFGTMVNVGFAIYAGLPDLVSSWWLVFVVLSAVLNHYFTVKALSGLIEKQSANAKNGAKILFYMVFKMTFLISGFACLLVFARNKVLHGLIIYIFQLIILGLSIKNIGNFLKKGTPP